MSKGWSSYFKDVRVEEMKRYSNGNSKCPEIKYLFIHALCLTRIVKTIPGENSSGQGKLSGEEKTNEAMRWDLSCYHFAEITALI